MDKLKAKILERYETQREFAKALGVPDSNLSRMLRGERGWKPETVWRAADLLGIPDNEIRSYFFTPTVAKNAKEKA